MKSIYIEEANDLLANLEIALLSLENNSNDKRFIEEVFRVMHTLKGNSSMFGLQTVAEFVHDLETIYDKVRNNEMFLNKDLLDCSFLCLDHLKVVIYDSELENAINKDNHHNLLKRIGSFIHLESVAEVQEVVAEQEAVSQKKNFYILFEPHANIFNNGTNPMYIVSEVTSFGNAIVVPHFKMHANKEQDPSECFTYWEIYLETEQSYNDIDDVFVFVKDSSSLQITELPISFSISNKDIIARVSKDMYSDVKIDLKALESYVNPVEQPIIEEEIKIMNEITALTEKPKREEVSTKNPDQKEKTASSIRVSSEKLDELMNLVSELVTTQAALTMYSNKNEQPELETIAENVEKLSRRLRDIAFGMTLVPINNMFGRFQRMVRDVSSSLNKEIEFVTEGGETELDKSIIETLTDPLMHILRNSLDHGIETADKRVMLGKSASGTVKLKAFYSGVYVYIQVSDDGKGLDPEKLKAKAISKGLIKPEDILTDEEAFDLIFYPGFSTAEKITDVSGRGVGMDVVRRNVSDLKGVIKVESVINEGTVLTIRLPLTLSIIDGLLVTIENVNYIIPLSVITKCYLVNNADLINNFNNLLFLDEEQVPFINIREEFGHSFDTTIQSQLIVVNNGERKVGLTVDSIIGEYQAVVKPLGKHYKNQDYVSGASILGDGTIALVLDANKLIELHAKLKLEEKI